VAAAVAAETTGVAVVAAVATIAAVAVVVVAAAIAGNQLLSETEPVRAASAAGFAIFGAFTTRSGACSALAARCG
jgi:hypothetical protein